MALEFGLDVSTPQSELVANVLVSLDQWERRVTAQRVSEALESLPLCDRVGLKSLLWGRLIGRAAA